MGITVVISSETTFTRTGLHWKMLVPYKRKFSAGLSVSNTTVIKKLKSDNKGTVECFNIAITECLKLLF